MSGHVTPGASREPAPHPLALRLVSALEAAGEGSRVLLLGIGNGRNVTPFLQRSVRVEAIEEDAARAASAARTFAAAEGVRIASAPYAGPFPFAPGYAGALSTHALLHGTQPAIAAALAAVAARLRAGAPFCLTLGSTRDPRFGNGSHLGANTFAPADGSERGVAHTYFDEAGAAALLAGFTLESLEETSAATTAGTWAHASTEAETIVHWFACVRRAAQQ